MTTFLLTWNPKNKDYETSEDHIIDLAEKVRTQGPQIEHWSTGNRTNVQSGDRVFLLRQGKEPRGIFGAGYAVEPAKGYSTKSYLFRIDQVFEPLTFAPLDPRKFKGELANMNWSPQSGGVTVVPAQALEKAWTEHVRNICELQRDIEEEAYSEGRVNFRTHLVRERNRKLIADAKAAFKKKHKRLFCQVCGFDFKKAYGELGDGFIEAHHLLPISQKSAGSKTKISDLAIVCSNCHRMFHRMESGTSVEEMKLMLIK